MTQTTQTIRPFAYTLELTADEYRTLDWMEAHGYGANLISNADQQDDHDDGRVTLSYFEASAWACLDEVQADQHAFGACATPALRTKIEAFIDGIV